MSVLNNFGCLFCYIHSELDDLSDKFIFSSVDSLNYPLQHFFLKVEDLRKKNSIDESLNIFAIVCTKDKMDEVREEIDRYIDNDGCKIDDESFLTIGSFINYVKFFFDNKNCIKKILINDDMVYFFIYSFNLDIENNDFFNSTINDWIDFVKPSQNGKQILTQNFFLKDLNGRRIISSLVDKNNKQKYLLVEGGLKVYLNQDYCYFREELGLNDINMFTPNDINKILMNPVYFLGRHFEPNELFMSYQKVLFYVLAIADFEININNIERIYKVFLDFISSEICEEFYATETFITKKMGWEVFLKLIDNIKGYLKGKNECIISKDYLLFLRSYYILIEPIKKIVNQTCFYQISNYHFSVEKYKKLLDDVDCDSNFEKGKSLESLVEYLFKNTKEFKVMARRIRSDREEIDISCANISCNSKLWELGAYILVESKNWKNKIGVDVIRQLGYISFYKGNTACILISRSGITSVSENEIKRLAVLGKYILSIELRELKQIESPGMFIDLIIKKYEALCNATFNDFGLLGE